MRKLTFEGFLKQYVAELSGVQTASVHKLADRMAENLRLKAENALLKKAKALVEAKKAQALLNGHGPSTN